MYKFCFASAPLKTRENTQTPMTQKSKQQMIYLKMNVVLKERAQIVKVIRTTLITYSYQLQVQLQGHREGKQTKESANTDPSN